MLDPSVLERDLQFLDELVKTDAFEALCRELPAHLGPGVTIVDLDCLIVSLRADCTSAQLALPGGSRSSAREASARVAHGLVELLRELMEARDSESAGWEALGLVEAEIS